MSNSDFLDDERRRLAYADRAETREGQHAGLSVEGLSEEQEERLEAIERRIRGGAECGKPTCCFGCGCPSRLADGTGRHSRKEMEGAKATGFAQEATTAAWDYALGTGPFAPAEATLCIHTVHGWRCVPGCRSHLTTAADEAPGIGVVEALAILSPQPVADTSALDALEQVAITYFAELDRSVLTMPQQRSLRMAKLVLVEAGRRVR